MNLIRVLFLIFVLVAPGRAELFVTHARGRPVAAAEAPVVERADLILQTHLLIRGVEYLKLEGAGEEGKDAPPRDAFRMPISGSLARGFADIRVLSEPLHDKILEVFRTKAYLKEVFPAERIRFHVAAPWRLRSPVRVANVDVVFGGELSVTFGVLRTESGFELAYPSRKIEEGRREPIFDLLDAELRDRVERAVLERYRKSLQDEKED